MLDLLENIRFAVRLTDLGHQRFLIDARVVVVDVEELPRERQAMDRVRLRFHAQIPVAGVMPSAAIQSGYGLSTREFRQRRGSLEITVEMIV